MGILNITPDSFYDGGKYKNESDIICHVENMLSDGATIIDVGAVSTRPNAVKITKEEEINRIKPVMLILSKKFPNAWFSVDTYRSEIAKMAVEEFGFGMVNDISAGNFDKKMFSEIAKLNIPYIIMHIQGTPINMQTNPTYNNVTQDIIFYFSKIINTLKQIGVNDILIDPGFGFGKTIENNYTLLKELKAFEILELPIVVGISRKSMIYKLLKTTPEYALNGTISANTLALLNGADILRVHDVKETVEAIKIFNMYLQS
ncbi:MAG: dihydropteroate synthase [Bacteroidetes bacterium CG02_land_8_20_14_3_00_31_25]|nr:dihydropteroate synthase [Bacteroidota bacterium]PIV58270.1 MAG: dihydropteroate synthase [Bacteroidetes bacterium CG02_land_8_20_14_3_00_31_25]PIX32841.1 MAG: dihydropteroate synthase [Bacteroidetes bacterium CG_4_8_14_3_um_filter_31_14]